MDSTGSILSDLNCLSKSEDDLGIDDIVMQAQRKKKWIYGYKLGDDYSTNKQCSTLDKVAEFNSPDGITTTRVKTNDDTCDTVPFKVQVTSNKENIDSKPLNTEAFANHSFVSKIAIKPETCDLCSKR